MTAPTKTPEAAAREQLERDYAELLTMASGAGRRFIKRMLAILGTYVDVLPGPKDSGNQIYVNAGCQKVGQELVREILDHAPGEWFAFYRDEIKDLMKRKETKS